ncbi:MAG: hypothetical protein ABIH00_08185 [Armatimonadota bacterium]
MATSPINPAGLPGRQQYIAQTNDIPASDEKSKGIIRNMKRNICGLLKLLEDYGFSIKDEQGKPVKIDEHIDSPLLYIFLLNISTTLPSMSFISTSMGILPGSVWVAHAIQGS